MLGNTKGKLINQYVPDYVLYDLETTGTSSKYDEVIEISAVKVKNGVVTEEFSQLVNPGRPIPSAASAAAEGSNPLPEAEDMTLKFVSYLFSC